MLKLSEVVDALSSVDINSTAYFNKKTNEILWKWDFNQEYSTYKEDDEFNDDIICMFDFTDKNDYDIMQSFINIVENEELRNRLYYCTKGKGAFRRFRKILEECDLIEEWYKYQDIEYKKMAKEWCIDNDIKFEEDC